MQKKALLALLVAAVLMFSGCALVVTDPVADMAQVVLEVNGETVTKGAMDQSVRTTIEQNNYYNQLYQQMMGQSAGYDTNPKTVLNTLMDNYTKSFVMNQKAKELKFDQLSEEDVNQVKELAKAEYDSMLSQIEQQYLAESENTGDALRAEAEKYAMDNGYMTLEDMEKEMQSRKALENLKEETVKDIQVEDAELEKLLAEKIEKEKADYEASLFNFGYAANNGQDYFYVPAGYRMVKQILVKFTAEDEKAIGEMNTALMDAQSAKAQADQAVTDAKAAVETPAEGADVEALKAAAAAAEAAAAEKQAAVDAAQANYDAAKEKAYENISAKAQEAYTKAAAGEDFDALIKTYNEDPGMVDADGNVKKGYALCADYVYFDKAFVDAAMSLAKVGDVAEPAKGSYGYYIVRYDADMTEGAKTLEESREVLTKEALTAKQDAHYEEVVSQWVAEADVKSYPEKMGY